MKRRLKPAGDDHGPHHSSGVRAMATLLSRFADERSGSVAIVFGLALLPILGFAGAAIDHARAVRTRTQLQAAADGSAMGALLAAVSSDQQRIAAAKALFASGDSSGERPTCGSL